MATKGFALASGQDVFTIETVGQSSSIPGIKLSGKEARDFYEHLMKDEKGKNVSSCARIRKDGRERPNSQRDVPPNRRARRRGVRPADVGQPDPAVQRGVESEGTQRTERFTELLGLRLLRCAHMGDTSGLRDLLSKGVDINFQDMYLWTAVMCACWMGQRAAVRLLLQRGAAWVGVVDMRGRDARDLALEGGHADVLEELESDGRITQREAASPNSAAQPRGCDTCRTTYTSSRPSHLSSTLHQFSLQQPLPTPYYCLPPSSKSYKMMVRCGWKPGTGLGPDGEGSKQPVPTVLKRDQKGLGYGHIKRARVTHFKARDREAVKKASSAGEEERGWRGQRKEESRRKEQEDKNWERDFRASFYL
ncbi:G patch domain and ankyrin repeat-containing protein 1 [Brachionichthys hirsutus]|uniref:G patch domain and ankyrin repeat-containing protein 1 n=1 Tax=Brachionichthys hirsutus TaxID=412623 RepID=UPI003604A1C0